MDYGNANAATRMAQDAMAQLAKAQRQLDEIEHAAEGICDMWVKGFMQTGQARSELAQLESRAQRLEGEGVDNVGLADLSEEGWVQAKKTKKELLRRFGVFLESELPSAFERLKGG